MKVLVFSDFHAHNYQEFSMVTEGVNSRLLEHLLCLDLISEDVVKLGVEVVCFVGDVFHLKNFVDSQVLKLTIKKFEDLAALVPVVMCPGNHDYRRWGSDPALLEVLSEFAGENVYLPTSVGVSVVKLCGWDFHVFPFTRDIDSLNLQLRNYQPSNKSIALLHQDIVGSMYGSFLVEKGLDPGVLESKFSYTFVGHFHDQKQVSSSVWSVGSPLMLSFGEQDQTKGWLFLDTDEGVVKQLTNCVSPRFRTVNIESDDTLSTITDEEASKDFFQFVVTGTSIPDLSRFRWKRVKVQATSDKRKRTSISFSDSPVELLTKYVKARNVNLDTDMLVQIGLKYLER